MPCFLCYSFFLLFLERTGEAATQGKRTHAFPSAINRNLSSYSVTRCHAAVFFFCYAIGLHKSESNPKSYRVSSFGIRPIRLFACLICVSFARVRCGWPFLLARNYAEHSKCTSLSLLAEGLRSIGIVECGRIEP